ncbi:MAG: signal peptidase I [Candidatus Brocadiia bacterium]
MAKNEKKEKAPKAKGGKSSLWSFLKTFIFALLLALLVRIFIFEIFKIPSCSMEPTLIGIDLSRGDRVGVNKLAYTFGSVKRYDVIVFESPSSVDGKITSRDIIKRVVGMPGEELSLVAGDAYANGKVAPKPLKVQDSIWIPIYSEDFSTNVWQRFWQVGSGDWSVDPKMGYLKGTGGTIRYHHWEQALKGGKAVYSAITDAYPRIATLPEAVCPFDGEKFNPRYFDCYSDEDLDTGRLDRGFVCPKCGKRFPYEGGRHDQSQPVVGDPEVAVPFWLGGRSVVGDLQYSAEITPRVRSGRISILIGRGRQGSLGFETYTLDLAIGAGEPPVLRTPDSSVQLGESARLQSDVTYKVRFALWDGRIFATVNGVQIVDAEYRLTGKELIGNAIELSLTDKTTADFDNVTIGRDIYYIAIDMRGKNPNQTGPGKYAVPAGKYFMLGDNSPASSDCRYGMPPVRPEDIVGRAFCVLWPPSSWKFLPGGE